MFSTIGNMFAGKKTFLVAAAIAIYAVLGYFLGRLEADVAWRTLLEAAAIAGLRDAMRRRE